MERRRSTRLDEEHEDVKKQVVAEAETQHSPLARRHSAYLPPDADDTRVHRAVSAMETIYRIQERYERRRAVDNAAFAVAMLGVALVFVDNEYAKSATATFVLRCANTILTVVLLALVVWRFLLERDILIQRNVLPPHVSVFRMPLRLLSLILELVICAICVPPGISGRLTVWEWKYHIAIDELESKLNTCVVPLKAFEGSCYLVYSYPYDILGLLALLRLYMIPRVILNLSDFSSYRASYLGAIHNVNTFSSVFAVKCFLRSHPFRVLAVGFTATLLLTSYALSIVEAPVNPTLAPLFNAMWLVVLTMGTIGYGDLTAVTLLGQTILMVGGMFTGILLFGVLSAAVFGFLALDERDQSFLHLLRRQDYDQWLKDASVQSIQAAWRYFHARTLLRGSKRVQSRLQQQLYHRLAKQRRLRSQSVEDYRSTVTELQHCQDQLLVSLRADHTVTMQNLRDMEQRLDGLILAATGALSSPHA
ncbi:hypothetical protein Poli38472_002400 [Pythium oligandrum]|uniref:Potassium channel domain-containing protein n=1 Tax=Pythium oligandrum TaxID=41045 RepID=A0A8K1CH45_PYTOL|nr:hypothetical protein Poli38472_002400 [Pythium oligandrum]|eukprot:TMW63459.1 hypothetical protein Poli38472_002400 [Pythium oligandrum]